MINECGEVNGITIGRGNPSTRRKSALEPLLFRRLFNDASNIENI
jgi:hypothetical protein